MTKQTFLNDKLKNYINASVEAKISEDNIIENLDSNFDLDIDWVFLRDGIFEKYHGRLASWEKIVGGLDD